MKRLNRKFITAMSAMLIALMALVFGMVGCDQGGGEDDEQPQSGLTLKGTEAGAAYAVRVYPFIEILEEEEVSFDAWTEATSEEKLAAKGEAKAEGEEVLVSLSVPDDSRFAGTDFFLVVVKTDGTERYAVAPFIDGSADLDLANMEDAPETPDYSIRLSQTGTLEFPSVNEGYAAQKATTITVTNTGKEATGELAVALSGDNAEAFTLSKSAITSIAVGKKMTFTVKPNTKLEAGVYTATVSVSGDNEIEAGFEVSFTVNNEDGSEPPEEPDPEYGIALSQKEPHSFGAVTLPAYTQPDALSVTVTNTGNQPTGALALKVSNTDFSVSRDTVGSIAVDKTETFLVRVNLGLGAGVYTATVTVSGDNIEEQSFDVSVTVNPAPTYGITLNQTTPHSFGTVTLPAYTQPDALSVTVTNNGNQPTGALTVALEGTDKDSFTVTPPSLSSIAEKDGTAAFTVVPSANLTFAKTHEATVKVTGGNGISESFGVSLTVNPAPFYGIGLDVSGTHEFGTVTLPTYTQPAALSVTVTSTSNQPTGALTVALDGTDKDSFTVTPPSLNSLAAKDGTATFTVVPNANLTFAKTHEATVSVTGANGINASFGVSFTVNPSPSYGISLSQTTPHSFGAVTLPNYSLPAALSVTVTNTGNQPTGALTVALEGTDSGSFTVTPPSLSSIAEKDGTATFTVVPNANLTEAKTHEATVKVTGANGSTGAPITASFGVSFTVNPVPSYGISLDPQTWTFPAATAGYGAQAGKPVNISNTGNQPTGNLTLALSNSTAFTLSPTSINSIGVNGSNSFTVTPKTGLAASTTPYTATVTVGNGLAGNQGVSKTFTVSFTVNPAPSYGISLDPQTWTFPAATAGYGTQTAKSVTVTNTGNQPTGNLTLALSNSTAFTLSTTSINSIAADGSSPFTVTPKTGLAVSTTPYTATVTVGNGLTGNQGVSKTFTVSFTVNPAPTYGISLDPQIWTFPAATAGYGTQTAKSVTVTNTGNQPTGNLTLALSNSTAFTLSTTSINSIAAGGSSPVTVTPKTGLAASTTPYTATVTVGNGLSGNQGVSKTFTVSFTVEPAPSSVSGFAALVTRMASDKNLASASYTLTGGTESYTTALSLTTANSPANVVINGGGRVVTGSANSITVGAGRTLTLRNITFTTLPLIVSAGGKLVLDTGAVVRDSAGTGVTVNGANAKFTMNGGTISGHPDSGVRITGGTFTMNDGTISGNTCGGMGAGVAVYSGGTVTMTGGKITGNNAGQGAGGIALGGGTLNLTGGEITGNYGYFVGGIYLQGGTLTGNPQIGGTTAPADGRAWVHGNSGGHADYYW